MENNKIMKKVVIAVLELISAAAITGCSFSVGNVPEEKSNEDLFPDRTDTSEQISSYVAYDFSLDGMGSMRVYVDTSEGHKFEVDKETSGFIIKDKDGAESLHAYCLEAETYKKGTAGLTNVKKINDRDFFCEKTGNYYSAFSYMADCGLDCGLIMQATDENALSLVSFEGTPLDGASDDIYFYQGTEDSGTTATEAAPTEPVTTTEAASAKPAEKSDAVSPDATDAGKHVNSSLSPEAEELLSELQSDYHKINWGVRYPVSKDLPYLVISIAPYMSDDEICLLIGITNLYDHDISFSGSAKAASKDDEIVGETYIYTGTVRSGNTVLETIYCGGKIPDGRIKWENCNIEADPYESFVPWEADYTLAESADGELILTYSVYGEDGAEIVPGYVYAVLLDSSGNVLAFDYDFSADTVAAGEKYEGRMVFQNNDMLADTADVCIFASSAK